VIPSACDGKVFFDGRTAGKPTRTTATHEQGIQTKNTLSVGQEKQQTSGGSDDRACNEKNPAKHH